jgi:uncharacterized integral membrane protein
MPGTNQAERLIMFISNNGTTLGNVTISYSSSTVSQPTNVMLIVGYAVGGLLLAVTIFLMVVIYRKRRNDGRPANAQNNEPVV